MNPILNRVRGRWIAGVAVLAAALSMGVTGARADLVLSDGTFQPQDWSGAIFLSVGNGGHLDLALQEPSGGDPGAFREVGLTVYGTDGQNPYCAVRAFSQYLAATYNPATQGALQSIDYTFDAELIEGQSAGQGTSLAILQNGVVYCAPQIITPEFTWTHHVAMQLAATDFTIYEYPGAHPDFSRNGPPMSFGFWTGIGVFDGQYTSIGGLDNWDVTLHQESPVPAKQTTWGQLKQKMR